VGGYAFGDSAAAARRLGLLADLFAPTTQALLERFAGRPLDLAVDLGCGTGHPTRLLASVLGPRRALGLDQSASFVALAAAGAPPGVAFAVHDVTAVPFPAGPADLCFCRLLLSHLPDPPATLAAWATQLAPGGLLLVDEVERIHTADPALRGYLDTAAALLASRGQTLEIGPVLHRSPTRPAWPAATTGSPPWPQRPPGRPPCSPRTCPSGAPRRSRTEWWASGRWASSSRTWELRQLAYRRL
jgi:trans-aconitate 2-methyltransferase